MSLGSLCQVSPVLPAVPGSSFASVGAGGPGWRVGFIFSVPWFPLHSCLFCNKHPTSVATPACCCFHREGTRLGRGGLHDAHLRGCWACLEASGTTAAGLRGSWLPGGPGSPGSGCAAWWQGPYPLETLYPQSLYSQEHRPPRILSHLIHGAPPSSVLVPKAEQEAEKGGGKKRQTDRQGWEVGEAGGGRGGPRLDHSLSPALGTGLIHPRCVC